MAEPSRKRARFFGNIEIEHRKLDRPFKKIAADEDPAGCLATSRCQMRKAFAKQYEKVEAVVDWELIKGGTFKWHTASFSKLFQVVCRESPSYKRLVLQAFLNRPPSTDCPWDLIVYADEVTPENILKVDNQRKMLAFYAAVKQMGPLVLKGDTCWLPFGNLAHEQGQGDTGWCERCLRGTIGSHVPGREALRSRWRCGGRHRGSRWCCALLFPPQQCARRWGCASRLVRKQGCLWEATLHMLQECSPRRLRGIHIFAASILQRAGRLRFGHR